MKLDSRLRGNDGGYVVCLTAQLKGQFEQSDKLEADIKKNLARLGYDA